MLGAAVREVVAVDRGDHAVGEAELGHGLADVLGLKAMSRDAERGRRPSSDDGHRTVDGLRPQDLARAMASRKGFEPLTYGLGNRCSILLSYRDTLLPYHGSRVWAKPRPYSAASAWRRWDSGS